MKLETFKWTTKDNLKIHGGICIPEGEIRAAVYILHGLAEYFDKYRFMADSLTEEGIAVCGYDLRGHGRSEGIRGHAPSFEHLLSELDYFIEYTRGKFLRKDIPSFLFGHSIGGNLAINYALEKGHKVTGIIASNPFLSPGTEKLSRRVLLKMGSIFNYIWPKLSIKFTLKRTELSPEEYFRKYVADPLVHSDLTLRLLYSTLKAGRRALKNASKLKTPTLIIHGMKDTVASHLASQKIALSAEASRLITLPDLSHDIHDMKLIKFLSKQSLDWIRLHSKVPK